MKTITTTLPIYNAKRKQLHERVSGVRQAIDEPVTIVCPRHRLPSFQWKDDGDGVSYPMSVKMVNKDYNGSGEALITDWTAHGGWDTTFNHALLEITQAKNVGAGACYATSDSFTVEVGDVIHVQGTMAGAIVSYPYLEFQNDAGYQFVLTDGSLDFEIIVRTSGTTNLRLISVGAIDFSFTSVSITKTSNVKELYYHWLGSIPTITNDYISYNGFTLKYLLDPGTYYLIIEGGGLNDYLTYYSEWFRVDCVYENLVTSWTNLNYAVFASTGSEITNAITGTTGAAISNTFSMDANESITAIFYLTNFSNLPILSLCDSSGAMHIVNCTNGLNEITFTATTGAYWPGDYYFQFNNVSAAQWYTTEIMVIRNYSTKYLTINFSNECDLGDILYHEGFEQTLWLESEPMEIAFPLEQEGLKNGEGKFVQTFGRQVKKYIARTMLLPDYMVEVFNRMKLHDTIELINLVGDVNDVYNLEVEHEWIDTDKYYARIDLTFDYDEAFSIAGCCNNLT